MEQESDRETGPEGWDWFEAIGYEPSTDMESLARSFARCFSGNDGEIALCHLRRSILDRRLGPSASDAELRFLEGQRSVVAHMLSMIDRSRD